MRAVDNASLTVAAGELVAVTGRSGSGKTTLLRSIAGLVVPRSGSIQVAGTTVTALTVAERRKLRREKVSLIFQDHNLIAELTAVENVLLAASLGRTRKSRADVGERAMAALDSVGLGQLGARLPATLSGGESQRVAIARALACSSSVLLADEPTGSLDVDNAVTVMAAFRAASDRGAGVIVATHDPEVVDRCDRSTVMDHGALADLA